MLDFFTLIFNALVHVYDILKNTRVETQKHSCFRAALNVLSRTYSKLRDSQSVPWTKSIFCLLMFAYLVSLSVPENLTSGEKLIFRENKLSFFIIIKSSCHLQLITVITIKNDYTLYKITWKKNISQTKIYAKEHWLSHLYSSMATIFICHYKAVKIWKIKKKCTLFSKALWGLGGGLAGKVPSLQVWGTAFRPSEATLKSGGALGPYNHSNQSAGPWAL